MNGAIRRRAVPLWMYSFVAFGIWFLWLAAVGRQEKGLMQERLHPGPGAKAGGFSAQMLYTLPFYLHFVLGWLDRSKYHRSDTVPLPAQIIGLIGLFASNALAMWAMTVNPFFSSVVRLQQDRGQRVITSGPYRYVRHPGYIGGIGVALFSPLALNSWLSSIFSVPALPFLVWRTNLEDTLLREGLEGYQEYAEMVPYRLVPGIW